jgi:hypothetical protein
MTATEKWDKEWFMNLPPKLKCLWVYLNDKCDQAGMWEINYRLASMHIGEQITEDDISVFGKRVEKFGHGKIWIVDHVSFQCGTLSDKSPAHKPIFNLLKKYSLLDRVLSRVSNTLQEIEPEIRKGQGNGQGQGTIHTKVEIFDSIFTDQILVEQLTMAHKGKDLKQAFEECYTHHSNAKNPPKELWEWRQKLNTWLTIKDDKKQSNGTRNGTEKGIRRADATITPSTGGFGKL